jgi:hypothetical protein
MAANLIGSLLVSLGLDDAKFRSGLTDAQKTLRRTESQFKKMGSTFSSVGRNMSLVMAPIAAGLIAAAKHGLDYASSLGEVAQQVGVTTRELQEFRYAASQVGVSQDEMDKGLAKLSVTLGKAAGGAKSAMKPFSELGVSVTDANGKVKTAGMVIPELADALAKIEDPARRAALEVAIFGKTGQKLDTLLSGGSAAINQLRDAAQKLGIVLSDKDIQNADDAADKFAAIKQVLTAKIGAVVAQNADAIVSAVTKIADVLTRALTAFDKLSPGIQTFIAAIGGIAIVLGPILMVLGPLITIMAPFLAQLKLISVAAMAASGGGAMGGLATIIVTVKAAFAGLLAVLSPIAIPLAAVAAAAALIYVNWDKIGPVLSALGAKFQEVLGPKLQELIATLTGILTALWEGPLGSLVRGAAVLLGELLSILLQVFGTVVIAAIGAVADAITGFFKIASNVFKLIGQILTGDFAGAWRTIDVIVKTAISTMLKVIANFAPGAVAYMVQMYQGVKVWVQDKLGAVWDWVIAKIKTVERAFFALADAVVFNSHIPDMVDQIGIHIARLQPLMVQPIQAATMGAGAAFANLTSEVDAANGELVTNTEQTTASIVDSFTQMAQGVLSSINQVVQGIKSGDWLSVLSGVLDTIDKIAGAASGGDGVSFLGMDFGGARANGGSVVPNKSYLVGERGPERFVPGRSGTIVSNDNMRSDTQRIEIVDTTGLFVTRVTDISGAQMQQGFTAIERSRTFRQGRAIG